MVRELFKEKAFHWANKKSPCCFLNSTEFSPDQHPSGFGHYDYLIAVGSIDELKLNQSALKGLEIFYLKHTQLKKNPWFFGYFTYDLKNEIEKLKSDNPDFIQFPALHFFVPEIVIESKSNSIKIHVHEDCKDWTEAKVLKEIEKTQIDDTKNEMDGLVSDFKARISKDEYFSSFAKLRQHIALGDIYELNFCFELFAVAKALEVEKLYNQITSTSPSPFSCYYSVDDKYLLSASMERFLAKRNNRIFSQPIKGTAARSEDILQDEKLKLKLSESVKEKAENIMIVDLVRNDLSKIASKGSVRVDELCQIYSYAHVHQMISTISCELKDGLNWLDAIKACFPMGSMTGAPKISAMNIIDQFERTKRGLYSGSVGYVDPFGNFDFNVVIRSLQYNAITKYLSLMVGSAVTAKSEAAQEYNECFIKANALMKSVIKSDIQNV